MAKIEIKNVSKSFGDLKVLDDISLTINKGDIYGVLGLSGAGKSTLVRCINGLETFDEGEILFNDKLLASPTHKVDRVNKRKIAMIFQSFNLLQQVDVLKNVEFALEINNIPNKKEKAIEALKLVGLGDKLHAYPSELSGGQAQRVAIARALVLEPEVLLSDEATSALDPETTSSILKLLKKLNKELGLTVIMISHQINVIEEICNRVAILSNAKLVEEGEFSDVFLNPKTDIAKSLIYSNHVKTLLDESKTIRLIFDGNLDEPVIANIVEECGILVSIMYADTKVIDGKMYGQLVFKLPKKTKDITKLRKYLDLHNIRYEEVHE
jgi:D-methionine transport system ATP-binding protein